MAGAAGPSSSTADAPDQPKLSAKPRRRSKLAPPRFKIPQSTSSRNMTGPSKSTGDQSQISPDLQLRYKLAPPTFKTLLTIPAKPDHRAVLEKACFATEFRSFPLKQAEKAFFRDVNDNSPIPYIVRETVTQPWHKVFLLVQIDLQNTGWPNKISAAARKELLQERGRIYSVLDHVLRCLVDILGQRHDGRGVTVALDILRSVKAGVWEGRDMELLQVESIGAGRMKKLGDAGVKNIRQLTKMEFYHIERLLSRNPPFGHTILHQLAGFPILIFKLNILSKHDGPLFGGSANTANPVTSWVSRITLGYENEQVPKWKSKSPWVTLVVEGEDGRLVWFWRGSVKRLEGGKEMVVCLEANKGEVLKVAFACEEIVGTMIRESFKL